MLFSTLYSDPRYSGNAGISVSALLVRIISNAYIIIILAGYLLCACHVTGLGDLCWYRERHLSAFGGRKACRQPHPLVAISSHPDTALPL